MIEAVLEVVILLLFRYPGAFVLWILGGCKKPFKEVLKRDSYLIGMIGLVTVGLVVVFLFVFLIV